MSDLISRQRLLSDLKELIAAWKKYPVMAEQIKGIETAIGYVKVIPSVKPDSKELSSTHKALDTISRQAAIVQLSHNKTGDDDCDVLIQNDIETIKALPSVKPERKNGKWIQDGHHIQCNQCGISICDKDREGDVLPKNFCPNCGSYNGGDENHENSHTV